MGGSSGLVFMERDSCLIGHGFKSQHRILNGHFFTLTTVKCTVCLKKTENKQ